VSPSVPVPGLNRRVRERIYKHVYDNDDHEVGGVLVGRLGPQALPVVTGAIAALEADGRRASVTFTHDAWSSIHEKLDRDYPDQQIVGWYHSHPGFGIFLSEHDRFIHDNFFSDPSQIAYVVDPHAGTEGVFGWQDGKLVLLEERPADRPGTGGRSSRPAALGGGSAWQSIKAAPLKYAAAVAVILAFAAGIAVLTLSGSTKPAPHSQLQTAIPKPGTKFGTHPRRHDQLRANKSHGAAAAGVSGKTGASARDGL
jgi:proteasome lid subunit RPN8/RPN11